MLALWPRTRYVGQHIEFQAINSTVPVCCVVDLQHTRLWALCPVLSVNVMTYEVISTYTQTHILFPPRSPVNVSSWSHSVTWVQIPQLMNTVSLTVNTRNISTVLGGLWLSLLNTRVSCLYPRVKPLPWGVVRSQPPWLTHDGPLYCWTVGTMWAHPKWRERRAEATFHTRAKGAIPSPQTIPMSRKMWGQ